MQLTDGRGQVRTTYAYNVFGAAYQGRLNSAANPHGYTGKRYEAVSGLYDYGKRDYNSGVSRWTTVDPVGAGNNWYGYANEDPVNFIDRPRSGLVITGERHSVPATKRKGQHLPKSMGGDGGCLRSLFLRSRIKSLRAVLVKR